MGFLQVCGAEHERKKPLILGTKLHAVHLLDPLIGVVFSYHCLITAQDRVPDKQHRPVCLITLEPGKSNARVFGLCHVLKSTNSTHRT